MSPYAWVTLVSKVEEVEKAIRLAQSLASVHTKAKVAALLASDINLHSSKSLGTYFDVVEKLSTLGPSSGSEARKFVCNKISSWKLLQYSKCVFLDCHTVVFHNCDELFEREEFAAVPSTLWPDCFNPNMFVFRPSTDTFNKLYELASNDGSLDDDDGGMLFFNTYFKDWALNDLSKRLSFVYQVTDSDSYTHLCAQINFGQYAKMAGRLSRPTGRLGREMQRNRLSILKKEMIRDVSNKCSTNMDLSIKSSSFTITSTGIPPSEWSPKPSSPHHRPISSNGHAYSSASTEDEVSLDEAFGASFQHSPSTYHKCGMSNITSFDLVQDCINKIINDDFEGQVHTDPFDYKPLVDDSPPATQSYLNENLEWEEDEEDDAFEVLSKVVSKERILGDSMLERQSKTVDPFWYYDENVKQYRKLTTPEESQRIPTISENRRACANIASESLELEKRKRNIKLLAQSLNAILVKIESKFVEDEELLGLLLQNISCIVEIIHNLRLPTMKLYHQRLHPIDGLVHKSKELVENIKDLMLELDRRNTNSELVPLFSGEGD